MSRIGMRKNVDTMMNIGRRKKSLGFSDRCRIWRMAMLSTLEITMSAAT